VVVESVRVATGLGRVTAGDQDARRTERAADGERRRPAHQFRFAGGEGLGRERECLQRGIYAWPASFLRRFHSRMRFGYPVAATS
jgi:hypothetical protein